MDTITHIALGICVTQLLCAKQAGKTVLLFGAAAQVFPDIDVMASLWLPPANNLLFHRGFFHSFLFGLIAALVFAMLVRKLSRSLQISFKNLSFLFCLQMWLHDLLDTCNGYGTGIFEPFSQQRFSFNLLYVVDPLFSLSLVVGALVLLLRKKSKVVKTWAALAVFTSCIYLFMAIFNKASVQTTIKKSLLNQNIVYSHLLVTPTPFNSFLWYIIAANDSGYYIGYRSVFDKKDVPVKYTYFKKNPLLLREAASEVGVKKLIQFAGDYYTVEKKERSLVVNVLRFGQILGWEDPDAQFALPFVVNAGNENTFIVQRGRFKGWNWRTISRMYYRIEH